MWIKITKNQAGQWKLSNDATFDYWDQLICHKQSLQEWVSKHNDCLLSPQLFHCTQQKHHEPV